MEIILVNDGFTDCCEENYETFKKKDNEVKVIHKRLCCKFMLKYWSENCIGKYIGFQTVTTILYNVCIK